MFSTCFVAQNQNLLLEECVESNFCVGQQMVFINVAFQQANFEKNSKNLLKVLKTNSWK